MVVEPARRLFTRDEYHKLGAAGIIGPDERVELLDGEILVKPVIGSRHGGCVKRSNRILTTALGDRAVVGVQDPVVLDDLSEPEPDLSIARPRADFYADDHPTPDELYLVVEVADSTALSDRNRKIPRYAAAGIREAWLVDLETGTLEVYRGPSPDGYTSRNDLVAGDTVSPEAFPDVRIAVADLLG